MLEQPGQEELHEEGRSGAIVATLSREIVGIYSRFHGRGPTKAKTLWQNGIVVCVLEDVFTRSEQILIDGDRFDQVREHRQALHETIEPLLRAVVEGATECRVEACLGQVSPEGTAAETFVLGERVA
jgi:uncharacterized protein YbcI